MQARIGHNSYYWAVLLLLLEAILVLSSLQPYRAEYAPGSVSVTQYQFGSTILHDYRGKVIFDGQQAGFQKVFWDFDHLPIQPLYGLESRSQLPRTTILRTLCYVQAPSNDRLLEYQALEFKTLLETFVGETSGCLKGSIVDQYNIIVPINNMLFKNRKNPGSWMLWGYESGSATVVQFGSK